MRELFDWRNWVVGILFCAGLFFLIIACGEPDPKMSETEWLTSILMFVSISGSCFGTMYFVTKYFDKQEANED